VAGDLDREQARSAVVRGWVKPADVAAAEQGGGPVVDALVARGLLSPLQRSQLRGMSLSFRPTGASHSFGTLGSVPVALPPPGSAPLGKGGLIDGRWRVLSVFEGGFGRVFLVESRDGKRLAFKTPRLERLSRPESIAELRAEFERWMLLGPHPHIVTAYLLTRFDSHPFLVMEAVEGGRTLAHEILEGKTDWKRAIRVGLEVALALGSAKEGAGLVHADLKPLNVLVTPAGTCKVSDFGLARILAAEGAREDLVGTPGYVAPELYMDPRALSERSDIYSFGVILHELATGAGPFPARDAIAAVIHDHVERPVADPRSLRSEIPEELAALIQGCLAKKPDARPESFAALYRTLLALHEKHLGPAGTFTWKVPSPVERLVQLSQNLLELGDRDAATEKARLALETDRDHAGAHFALGNALLDAGKALEAKGHFLEAHKRGGGKLDTTINMAHVHLALGQKDEAGWWLDRAIVRAGETSEFGALAQSILLAVEARGLEPALALCDRIVAADPGAVAAWSNRAVVLGQLGRHAAALESADRALAINPAYAKGWNGRTDALLSLKRYPEALESAEKAVAFDPGLVRAWGGKITALVNLGREADARATLDAAFRVHPGNGTLEKYAGALRKPEAIPPGIRQILGELDPVDPRRAWRCPHCKGLNPKSAQVELLQDMARQGGSMVVFQDSLTCRACGKAVALEAIVARRHEASGPPSRLTNVMLSGLVLALIGGAISAYNEQGFWLGAGIGFALGAFWTAFIEKAPK
jgi:tetratricopeptide (TPR) repeat protein